MPKRSLVKLLTCAFIGTVVWLPGDSTLMLAEEAPPTNAATSEVALPVTVRDKHGKIIRDLSKDDFTLQEDGRPQTIRYFTQDANLPLTLGVLVDTSHGQAHALETEKNASRSFFDQMVRDKHNKDKAFLVHFDRQVELLQDLTSSREKLQSALELLKTSADPDTSNDPKDADDSKAGPRRARTQLYDAVYLASNELMKSQKGRKALVILSDGVDRGSKTYLNGAIESAQRADVFIYSIYFADSRREERNEGQSQDRRTGRGGGWPPGSGGGGWPGGGGGWPGGGGGGGRRGGGGSQRPTEESHGEGKKVLERISKETGGRFFEVSKKESLGEIYNNIVEELRNQYIMGYVPDKDSSTSGYHHLKLEVKRKDAAVQTRDGYFAD